MMLLLVESFERFMNFTHPAGRANRTAFRTGLGSTKYVFRTNVLTTIRTSSSRLANVLGFRTGRKQCPVILVRQ